MGTVAGWALGGRGRDAASLRARLLIALAVSAAMACGATAAKAEENAANPLLACRAISDDAARLRCFDAATAAAEPAGSGVVLLDDTAEPAPRSAQPRRPTFRVEAGYGLSIGDYSGSSGVARHGTLVSQSATGGSGGGLLAEAWLDDWLHKDVSIGLGYVEVGNKALFSATLPQGVSILTDPTRAEISAVARADLFMINLAYRPQAYGRLRPIIGFGLGGGPASIKGLQALQNAFVGTGSASERTASPVPALQIYTGVETDLTRHLHLDLVPRLLWVGAAPFGNGLRYTDFILGADIGYQF